MLANFFVALTSEQKFIYFSKNVSMQQSSDQDIVSYQLINKLIPENTILKFGTARSMII